MFAWLKRLFSKKSVTVQPLPKVNEKPKLEVVPEPDHGIPPEELRPKEAVKNTCTPRYPDWSILWYSSVVDKKREDEIIRVCEKILLNRSRYELVEQYTGVPWDVIAVLHYREASLNFNTVLHNGEKLSDVEKYGTRLVPKGRGKGRNWTWEEACIDAIQFDGLHKKDYSTIGKKIAVAERYNGLGYRPKGIYSPYCTAGTNHYKKGKFTSDGKFDPNFIDRQLGAIAIFKGLGIV